MRSALGLLDLGEEAFGRKLLDVLGSCWGWALWASGLVEVVGGNWLSHPCRLLFQRELTSNGTRPL
jgi:hypothetical protein